MAVGSTQVDDRPPTDPADLARSDLHDIESVVTELACGSASRPWSIYAEPRVLARFHDGAPPLDPWGRPYRYSPRDDDTFELRSLGPDGRHDSDPRGSDAQDLTNEDSDLDEQSHLDAPDDIHIRGRFLRRPSPLAYTLPTPSR